MGLDDRLPYLLQRNHIARIEGDSLLIGDRRRYPWEKSFVRCQSVEEASNAIKEMVTQGGGSLQVGLTAMRFVARRMEEGRLEKSGEVFCKAVSCLSASRPTNTTMRRTLEFLLDAILQWFSQRDHTVSLTEHVDALVDSMEARFDEAYDRMSDLGASSIMDGETILTTCFAEHSFVLSLSKALEAGKHIAVIVPETRPYLQGSRLTAPSLQELGIPVTLITDGMGAHLMAEGKVHRYLTAADVLTLDGTVVNKTGTLAYAICASYYGIPYQAFALFADTQKKDAAAIVIEERDPEEVTHCLGMRTTSEGIPARYPAFDIILPSLVDSVITPKGIFKPSEVKSVYGGSKVGMDFLWH